MQEIIKIPPESTLTESEIQYNFRITKRLLHKLDFKFFHCAYFSSEDILFRFFNEKYGSRAEIRRISDPDWICMQILMQLSSGRLNIWNKMDFPDPDVKLSNLNWHLKKLSRGYHKKQELKKLQYSEAPTYKKRK